MVTPMTPSGRRRASVRAAVLVAALLALAACSGPPPAPETTAPPGYTVVSDAENGFAVAVPSHWQRIPMTTDLEVFDRNVNRIRLDNPKLASAIVLARVIAGSSGKMMAVDPEGVTSVNLTVADAQEETLDELASKVTDKLREDGATDLTEERVPVAGRPGIKLTFTFPVEIDAGKVPTEEIQYYAIREGKTYILTVMGADPEVAENIAKSLAIR